MKLHLGCGEVHLLDYINIDFPPEFHTVQVDKAADEYHNILELSYPPESIDEIRHHHVFEHFSRAVAIGLLAGWWSWLKPEGLLHIEVPDFNRTALSVLDPFSSERKKMVGLRHIFGSQEADWAVHYEGWSSQRLKKLLKQMGFRINKIEKQSYKATYNFHIYAQKQVNQLSQNDFRDIARLWLKKSLVDESVSELKMLEIWMEQFDNQIKKTWAKE